MKVATLLIAGSVLIGSAGLAFAQAPAGGGAPGAGAPGAGGRGGAMRAACGDDIAKLCAGKAGPDIRSCITDNKDKVSATCKAALDAPRPAPAP